MPGDKSLTVLVERLMAGDTSAAQPLWESCYPRLIKLARKHLRGVPRRAADEDDVVLSAFDSFCRGAFQGRFPRLDDRDALWGLLVTITVRKAADLANHARRKKRGGGDVRGDSVVANSTSHGPGMDAFPSKVAAPELAAELAEEFERLLGRLTGHAHLREIALLKMEGHTNEEVAARLGCAAVTVERRLSKIRKILAD
jgi:RNA polymerase sigma factor (sigma-70 family)